MRRKTRKINKEVYIITQALGDKFLSLGVEKVNSKISRIITIDVIPRIYNKNKIIEFYIGNI